MHKTFLSAVLGPALFVSMSFAAPPLAELAPESTVLLAGVRNVDAVRAKLDQTGLLGLMEEDAFKEWIDTALQNFDEELEQAAADAGFEKDDLSCPSGELGLAVFAAKGENGQPVPGFLAVADFGANAEKMEGIVRAMLDHEADGADVEWEEEEVRGRTVLVFTAIQPEEDEEGMMGGGMVDPEAVLDAAIERTWLVREGGTFMLTNHRESLDAALGICDGDAGGALAARDDFRGLTSMLEGEHDAYAMFLSREFGRVIAAADPMGMAAMIGPMVKQLIGDIGGIGLVYDLATESAMIEGAGAVYMPNGRAGLSAMFETESAIDAMPSFAGGNAISYSRVNFDFEKMPAFVAQVMQMAAMFGAPQPAPGEGPTPQEVVGQFTACLGKSIQIVQSLDRPITATSMRQVVAIECTKAEEMENLVSTFGAGMGLEGRDFMGHRIYAMDAAMLGMIAPVPMDVGAEPYALGLGSGQAFIGTESAVEQALRAAGDAQGGEVDPEIQRAIDALDAQAALAWGWGDWLSSMEAQVVVSEAEMDKLIEEIGADDPELAAEFADMNGMGGPLAMLGDVDWDVLRRYFGPASWIVHVRENGFVGKSYMLKP